MMRAYKTMRLVMKLVTESVSKTSIEVIREYFDVNEQIKLLEKKKDQLKAEVKEIAKTPIFVASEFIVSRSKRTTSRLDKEGLSAAVGVELIKKYEIQTSYEVLEVKRINQ